MSTIKPKRRRCKICREWFQYRDFRIWWCCPEHGAIYATQKRAADQEKKRKEEAQQERRNTKIRKLAVKPLKYFHKQAQTAFNEYIRTRDAADPCISCGRFHDGQWHAGHFRTVKASPETRYDEDGCHKQCMPCNHHLSGNIGEYKPRLIEKIGQEAFDRLMGTHELKKWTREELQELAAHYRQKTRELIKRREVAA
ncbi:protein NinG [Izhakiella australiensis]|uniref:Protein NinG n=2 Tax=Izhakiella australiensis TaxID=1926881 RepID=A0A1S8Y988_9GAMM|nr:recombination protein NinG [Izhakiella australiensis]OON35624.1 protein NinG [Izhakiella australiensis]